MKKSIGLLLVFGLSALVPAAVITGVERANGSTGDRPPVGVFSSNTAPLPMPKGGLQNGTGTDTPYVYSDRTFWWGNVPEEMVGWEHVLTFNNDKGTDAVDVTYTVTTSRTATIWIAFDSRLMNETSWVGVLPPWGNGSKPTSLQALVDWLTRGIAESGTFTDTGLTLGVRESASTLRNYRVFSALLPAGTYIFRHQSNKNDSNYIMGAVTSPNKAWGPDPAGKQTLVPVDSILSWQAPEDPNIEAVVGYDIYLDPNEARVAGADPSVRVSTGQTATIFNPTPDLLHNTQYFWRVDVSIVYDDEPNHVAVINSGSVWTFTTAPEIPMITRNPAGQSRGPACGTPDAELSIQATNATEYQWYKNNEIIPDAINATLRITGVSPADEGQYFCRASNASGSVDSAVVWLEYARQTSHWNFEGNYTDAIGGYEIIPAGEPAVPTFASGKIGNAAVFDGIDDYAMIPVDALPRNQHTMSLAFWALNNAGSATSTLLYANAIAAPTSRIVNIQYAGTSANFDLSNSDSIEGSYDRAAATMRMVTNPWVYWVVTKDAEAGTIRAYQNGVKLAENTDARRLFYGVEQFFVGGRGADLGQFFKGSIDDLRIYNYALDPVEIAYLYRDVTGETVCVNPGDPVLLAYDLNGDCAVDMGDLAAFASNWLACQRIPDCIERP